MRLSPCSRIYKNFWKLFKARDFRNVLYILKQGVIKIFYKLLKKARELRKFYKLLKKSKQSKAKDLIKVLETFEQSKQAMLLENICKREFYSFEMFS